VGKKKMPVHGTEGHIDHRGSKRQSGSSLPDFLIGPSVEMGETMALRVCTREGDGPDRHTLGSGMCQIHRGAINTGYFRQSWYPEKELQSRGVSCEPLNVIKVWVEVQL